RVCDFGSVSVKDLMIIERYSHVMHIVSQVEGKLSPDKTIYDLMRATFPAGTLSGAPKIRAMQIIAELEQTARGPYGGCVGYFSFNGNLDTCITIRTALVKNGKAYVQAGGGWVNDSTPEAEFQETVNKAQAMLKAVALAERFGREAKRNVRRETRIRGSHSITFHASRFAFPIGCSPDYAGQWNEDLRRTEFSRPPHRGRGIGWFREIHSDLFAQALA